MNNERGAANISLGIFGGLCSEMAASDLPEGASPLTFDTDFLVGSVRTRDGLQSVYSFANTTLHLLPLSFGTPDQTGYSFRSALSLTSWFAGSWAFVPNHNSAIYFTFRVPSGVAAIPQAKVVLELYCADSTGKTANFQTSDGVIASGGDMNLGALASASQQLYTTPVSAYQPTQLIFAVQSTFVAGDILVIKIATSSFGSAPSSRILMFPSLSLNMAA